jgi:hypothetical protein
MSVGKMVFGKRTPCPLRLSAAENLERFESFFIEKCIPGKGDVVSGAFQKKLYILRQML